MTYEELITHQYANDLKDEWFVAVSGNISSIKKTLIEIKSLKDSAPELDIQLLHVSDAENPNAQWLLLESREEIHQKSIPQKAVFHKEYSKFNATSEQMLNVAQEAIVKLGYTVTSVSDRLIGFETGMSWGSWSGVKGSISIIEHEPYWFTAQGSGKQNVSGLQLAALDFGEAKGKASKVIEVMRQIASP